MTDSRVFPPCPMRRGRVCCAWSPIRTTWNMASAAVATWTARGVDVTYLLPSPRPVCSAPEEVGPLRAGEHQACASVGVHDLRILDHADGMRPCRLWSCRDIAGDPAGAPDAVVTANFDEAWRATRPTHRAAGRRQRDRVRDADNTPGLRELGRRRGPPKPADLRRPRWLVAGHPVTDPRGGSSTRLAAVVARSPPRAHQAYPPTAGPRRPHPQSPDRGRAPSTPTTIRSRAVNAPERSREAGRHHRSAGRGRPRSAPQRRVCAIPSRWLRPYRPPSRRPGRSGAPRWSGRRGRRRSACGKNCRRASRPTGTRSSRGVWARTIAATSATQAVASPAGPRARIRSSPHRS